MIYFRKFIDMFFTSMVPSIVAFILMWRFMSYRTWIVSCILCTLIFFLGNLLLIRRFARDMVSKYDYYTVWLITYAVYAVLGTLCLVNNWMYPFTWIYFHTRIFEIVTLSWSNNISTVFSFAISMIIYLAMILFTYPIFVKNYKNELLLKSKRREIERHRRYEEQRKHEMERRMASAKSAENEHNPPAVASETMTMRELQKARQRSTSSDTRLYSKSELRKMDKMNASGLVRRKRVIYGNKKDGKRIIDNILGVVLEMGSYSFYQMLKEKKTMGLDTRPIVQSYLRRMLTFGRRK